MAKKSKKSLKKYMTGTAVTDYIEDPNTVLAQNDINISKAKYKAESNPWLLGMQAVGNAGLSYGLNQAGAGEFAEPAKGLANMKLAMGGTAQNVPVEVEGDEVMETPDGSVAEFDGPSHENGGIPINLPEGTEIFSKRIQKMGKSMAERKINREKKVSKLEKILTKNPKDTLTKKTLNKILANNEKEEQSDMQLQEDMTRMMEDSIMMACGGTARQKMVNGSSGIQLADNQQTMNNWYSQNTMGAGMQPQQQAPSNNILVDNIGNESLGREIQLPNNQQTANNFSLGEQSPTPNPQLMANTGGGSKFANLLSGMDTSNLPTAGDAVGLAGSMVSTFSPYLNTLKNRASDTPNVNYYEDYGREGLETIQDTKQYVGQERDKALQDLQLSRNSAVSRNRNSARGINTLRAFDLAADQAANKATGDIYSNFSSQMMGIMGQEAGMQNQQDQVVMGGERAKDTADRMDKDNFYTQRGSGLANIGTGLQATGKSLNQIKGRGDNADMINQLKQMGFDENQVNNLMQMFLKSQVNTAQ